MTETITAPRRRLVTRVAVLIAVILAAWHIFATFLWIAPKSPLREVVPGNALSSYMLPFFGQSWSVFAPEPINGDYFLDVRATVDGEATEWVRATDVEISLIRNNLFPPRGGIQSTDVSSQFKGAWDKLSDEGKAVAELNYFKDEWEPRMEQALTASDDAAVTERYMAQEHRATAYATQVARAMWGEDVEQVQFKASRQNVIPFAQRHDPEAKRPAEQPAPTGWRGVVVEPGQSGENFRDVFTRQHERVGS